MAAVPDLSVDVRCDVCLDRGEDAEPLPPGRLARVRITAGPRSGALELCPAHKVELDELLAPWLALGQRSRQPDMSTFPRLLPGEHRETIRAWALARGLPVARTGTISAAVLADWRDRERVSP